MKNEEIKEVTESAKKRKEKTNKLINRIIELNKKKGLDDSSERSHVNISKLTVNKSNQKVGINVSDLDPPKRDSDLSNKGPSPERLQLTSPKPPKPTRRPESDSNLMSHSGSINVTQLLKETQVAVDKQVPNQRQSVRKVSKEQKKIKVLSKNKIEKIDINNVKLKTSGKAPVLKLKKVHIESKFEDF